MIKDPNHASVVPYDIKATFPRTSAEIQTTNPFGDDRQSTANDYIQEQKLVSTKNEKGTEDYGLILYKMTSYDEQSQ